MVKAKENIEENMEESLNNNQINENESDYKWYIVHTQSGKEFDAKKALEKSVAHDNYKKIDEVIVPIYKETVYKNGKKRKVEKKSFPGYICVHMVMDLESKNYVSSCSFISGFLARQDQLPVPLSKNEMSMVLSRSQEETPDNFPVEFDFSIGQKILIVDGPFNNFSGTVKAISPEKGKVSVSIEIFGRETPVEIDYYKVKKQ